MKGKAGGEGEGGSKEYDIHAKFPFIHTEWCISYDEKDFITNKISICAFIFIFICLKEMFFGIVDGKTIIQFHINEFYLLFLYVYLLFRLFIPVNSCDLVQLWAHSRSIWKRSMMHLVLMAFLNIHISFIHLFIHNFLFFFGLATFIWLFRASFELLYYSLSLIYVSSELVTECRSRMKASFNYIIFNYFLF